MFTGIVEERGEVREASPYRLVIGCERVLRDSGIDASVAVNGVCLTVVERGDGTLAFDVTPETLDRSSLGRLVAGDPVNLERPLTLSTRLGGHLVQGHVDGVGTVERVESNEAGATLTVRAPGGIMRYVVEKGSITVDGISLTIAVIDGDTFAIALIPHTLDVTTLGTASPGDPVNLEVDVIAKYVEGFLTQGDRS
jgi:riboflavin synthase